MNGNHNSNYKIIKQQHKIHETLAFYFFDTHVFVDIWILALAALVALCLTTRLRIVFVFLSSSVLVPFGLFPVGRGCYTTAFQL